MTVVAVVTPTLPERRSFLRRAMTSVQTQTAEVDLRMTIHIDQEGVGAAAARNVAIGLVDPDVEWLAFLDDDDELYPQHVERLLECAYETGADVIYPWFDGPNADAQILKTVKDGEKVDPEGVEFGPEQAGYLRHFDSWIPVTVLARAVMVREVGGFPQDGDDDRRPDNHGPVFCDEWGLWTRLLDAGAQFAHHPERTWRYYVHGNNTSGRGRR